MGRAAGVHRTGPQLDQALETIDTWCRYALPRQFLESQGWEFQNMLTVSRMIIEMALRREESRGVHLRGDFPAQDDVRWQQRLSMVRP